ncbi:MAG: hypothetical protein GQ534_02215 [Candidatus Delongbacteria bacterium]|nr:hypothetical protein [Candidatus Delongbacteria bacterium]
MDIYNSSDKLVQNIDLSNVCKGVTADYFIKYDNLNSYLFSSISGIIYLLDEDYNLKSSLDLNKLFSLNFHSKIYPINYNSLLVASDELDKFYILENKELNEILTFTEMPIDFFFYEDKILILFDDRVEVYSETGVYLRSLPFKDIKYVSKIYFSENRVFVKHSDGIDRLNFDKIQNKIEYQARVVEEKEILDFAVIENKIAILKDNKISFRVLSDR